MSEKNKSLLLGTGLNGLVGSKIVSTLGQNYKFENIDINDPTNPIDITKTEQAKLVGKLIAEKAVANGISQVVFDRNGYLYHGRVKSLAEAARENGLKF